MSEHSNTVDVTESGHIRPHDLAAYLDGGASEGERALVEAHLSACSACCEELIEVRRLRAESPHRRRVGWYLAGAASAAAVLAILLVGQPWKEPTPGAVLPSTQRAPSAAAPGVKTLSPGDGEGVGAEGLVFSWRPAGAGPVLYNLVLTTEEGDSIWAATTRDTIVAPPEGDVLEPGRTYLWYVDALLSDGRPASSGVRHFRIEP